MKTAQASQPTDCPQSETPTGYVIDDGEAIEEGSHRQLMRKKGHYYELYMNQFKNEKHKVP